MKRALAERAKQSGHPNGLSPSVITSSQPPPQKIPKLESPEAVVSSVGKSSVTSPAIVEVGSTEMSRNERIPSSPRDPGRRSSTSSSKDKPSLKRQRQRQRVVAASPAAEEDDSPNSTFFLKHQNSALSSELKQLQYHFRLLEEEREYRRKQCDEANKSLHALEAAWIDMEVALQLGQQPVSESKGQDHSIENAPRSTGTGESVELIGALLDSLAAIAKAKDVPLDKEGKRLDSMKRVASLVRKRASALQRWIWALLTKVSAGDKVKHESVVNAAELQTQISLLKSKCRDYEVRVTELAKSRDEALESERKVRRGLYRIASGRMKLEEVLKAVNEEGDGLTDMLDREVAAAAPQVPLGLVEKGDDSDESVLQLKKQLQDMEEIASSRKKQIEKLRQESERLSRKVNDLSSAPEVAKSDVDVKQSALYIEAMSKLATAERRLEELTVKQRNVDDELASARGDADAAQKSSEDLVAKHQKRWAELVGEDEVLDGRPAVSNALVARAKTTSDIENKLRQALESVRQADVIRSSLDEATLLNEMLHSKLEETRAKNSALVAGKASRPVEAGPTSKEKNSQPATHQAESKYEKIHRENRRMRKDIAAAFASRDAARSKLERAEKERDSLMKTNTRLLKQSSEMDDINAKSLSTILHLKDVTEKMRTEKELLAQQLKSKKQLSLSMRLVSNAKERLTEVIAKERAEWTDKVKELEKTCENLKDDREAAVSALSCKEADMSRMKTETSRIRERCDALVADAAAQAEEKQRLVESLAVAQRETSVAAKRVAQFQSQGGNGDASGFTTEELSTQISVLKSRLACPVCNHRDKKCILLRCRHMFCKQCVEENIRNRSRKCPACGQRFDNKDVEDIWL